MIISWVAEDIVDHDGHLMTAGTVTNEDSSVSYVYCTYCKMPVKMEVR